MLLPIIDELSPTSLKLILLT